MDGNDEWERKRVEHARNPNTDSTPRTAAAEEVGQKLAARKLGKLAVDALANSNHECPNLTTDEQVRAVGARIRSAVDMDAIPSRLELLQKYETERADADPDPATRSLEIGEQRRWAMLDQLGLDHVETVAHDVATEPPTD